MTLPNFNFTTGPASLPDVGKLSYNGVTFSPLFATQVTGNPTKDSASRTVRYVEYDLVADGYVTLPAGATDVSATMANLQEKLNSQGGVLVYRGRGFDLVVNQQGSVKDVAWGPVPELIDFQPMGGGLSAKVKWRVRTRLPVVPFVDPVNRLLQFSCETTVTYGQDGYSSLGVRGTMEVPMTRGPAQGAIAARTLDHTVDDFRDQLDRRIFAGIDLVRFTVTKRDFSVSRDKRTMEFDVACEEKPYIDLPPYCTMARGSYSVKPARAGMGLCLWLCTLRASYVVRRDFGRGRAWLAFLDLLQLRMASSVSGVIPTPLAQNPVVPGIAGLANAGANAISPLGNLAVQQTVQLGGLALRPNRQLATGQRAFLIDFNMDEGLYLDSKTTTFSATWRLLTTFSHIILASGLWRKVPEFDGTGGNLWAASMAVPGAVAVGGGRNVMGSNSWLLNRLDPRLDVIVDFGGG